MRQPAAVFCCHATPDHACHGWAVVGIDKVPHGHDLLAARLGLLDGPVPDESVPLFDSHTEAAEHGLRDIDRPDEESCAVQDRLIRKYERLRS